MRHARTRMHAHAHAVVTAVWHGAAACPVTPHKPMGGALPMPPLNT